MKSQEAPGGALLCNLELGLFGPDALPEGCHSKGGRVLQDARRLPLTLLPLFQRTARPVVKRAEGTPRRNRLFQPVL